MDDLYEDDSDREVWWKQTDLAGLSENELRWHLRSCEMYLPLSRNDAQQQREISAHLDAVLFEIERRLNQA